MTPLLLMVMLAGPPAKATAPFEGVLEYQLVLQGGSGSITTSVSALGVHTTGTVNYLDQVTQTTVVVRSASLRR